MSGQLKEIKDRIGTVDDIQQITKAMKMVSAAKLRRARQAIERLRPYANQLHEVLNHVMQASEDLKLDFAEEREPNNVLVLLMTSDRGLCGSFNMNLIRVARRLLKKKYKKQRKEGNLEFLCVGKQGAQRLKKEKVPLNTEYQDLFNDLTYQNVAELAEWMMQAFLDEKYDRIEVIYAQFKNPAKQFFDNEQFLPLTPFEDEDDNEETGKSSEVKPDYIFEPSQKEILDDLIPFILKTYLYRAFRDNFASEHGARMVAMDNATENAEELLEDLRLSYNRARQAAITKEISEIVGGAAALEEG